MFELKILNLWCSWLMLLFLVIFHNNLLLSSFNIVRLMTPISILVYKKHLYVLQTTSNLKYLENNIFWVRTWMIDSVKITIITEKMSLIWGQILLSRWGTLAVFDDLLLLSDVVCWRVDDSSSFDLDYGFGLPLNCEANYEVQEPPRALKYFFKKSSLFSSGNQACWNCASVFVLYWA